MNQPVHKDTSPMTADIYGRTPPPKPQSKAPGSAVHMHKPDPIANTHAQIAHASNAGSAPMTKPGHQCVGFEVNGRWFLYSYKIVMKSGRAVIAHSKDSLQEALVNAAKHGNNLDPSKTIIVQFTITGREYSWVITDEGTGFVPQCGCHQTVAEHLPPEESEHGRGLCILHEIFDHVHWNREGTQLTLSKSVKKS